MADRNLSLGTIFTADIKDFRKNVQALRQQMNAFNNSVKDQARQMVGAASATRRMLTGQQLVDRAIRQSTTANKTYGQALRANFALTDKTVAAAKSSISHFQKLQKSVYAHAQALNSAGKNGAAFAKTVNYAALSQDVLDGKLKATSRGFAGYSRELEKFGRVQGWVGKQIAQVHGALERVTAAAKVTAAYGLAATAIFSMVNAFKVGVLEIVNFDQALKNLEAITRPTGAELRSMAETIKRVATTTKFSTVEVAEAMVLLGQAGFSATESIDAIEGVTALATGTLTDMSVAADLLTTAIRAFGKEAFQASEIADVMANAINKSKLTVDKLRISFNYVGPAANAAGAELEEVAAAMMSLANSGLRASTIGTGLRQIFSRLVAPSSRLREVMESHNIALEDLDISMHGFQGVLFNLVDTFVDLETGLVDSRKAFELFGLRGANAMLALVRAVQSGEYQRMLESVYEVGTAAEMAQTQIEGLALKFKNLQDRAKVLAIEIGEGGLKGLIGLLADALKGLINVLVDLVKNPLGQTVVTFGLFTAAIWSAMIAIGAIVLGVAKLTQYFGKFWKVIAGHKLSLIITAVSALVTWFYHAERATKAETEALEDQAMQLESSLGKLESYQRRLKEAWEAGKENESVMFRYTNILKRLNEEFPELSQAINEAGGDFERINELIKEERIRRYNEAIRDSAVLVDKYKEALKELAWYHGLLAKAKEKAELFWNYVKFGADQAADAVRDYIRQQKEAAEGDYLQPFQDPTGLGLIIGGLARDVEWLATKWKNFRKSTEGTFEEAGKGTNVYRAKIRDIAAEIEKSSKNYAELAVVSEWTKDQMVQHLRSIESETDKTTEEIEKMIDVAKKWYDTLQPRLAFEIQRPTTPLEEMLSRTDITEAQRVELAAIQKNVESKISAYKEFATKRKNIEINVAEGVAAIQAAGLRRMRQALDQTVEYKWRTAEKDIEFARASQGVWDNSLTAIYNATKENYRKRLAQEEEGSAMYKAIKKRETNALEGVLKQREAMHKAFEQEITQLTIDMGIERNEFERRAALRGAQERANALIAMHERYVMSLQENERESAIEIAKINRDIAERQYIQTQEKLADLRRRNYAEESSEIESALDERLAAQKRYQDSVTALQRAEYQKWKYDWDMRWKYMDGYWASGVVSAQEYYEMLQQARDMDIIDAEEYIDRLTEIQGNMWDNFLRGIQRTKREFGSWGRSMQQIGEQVAGQFADNMTDAFSEFIDGTKDAGEAFRDFAVSTLKWMGEMLMRMQMMRMFLSFFPSAAPAAPAAGAAPAAAPAATGGAGPIMRVAHGGGIIGRDSLPVRIVNADIFRDAVRAHNGLMAGEVPLIAKRGEGIFTPGQMQALAQMAGNLSINVPVSVEGAYGLASKLRQNIEDAVKKTLREELR